MLKRILNFLQHSTFSIQHCHRRCPMPQEFLRDVLRTGDAPGRARRRLSVLPISIAAHVMAVSIFVMSPFVTDAELPAIAAPLPTYMDAMPAPPPVAPAPIAVAPSTVAPTVAPSTISDTEEPRGPSGPPVEGALTSGPGVESGAPLMPYLETGTPTPPAPPPPPPVQKPVRVGPGIREPKKLVHVAPQYPVIALQTKVQGVVILEAILDVTGRVDRVKVLRGHPLLDDAAIRAVEQWRYTPTELNGVPVPVLMTITVNFSLTQ
jgi:protein TonB